ncbi:restriction endonuclease [Halegenticoccus tardaugens]|uniref:restriction endonuclease n=1 Tax=Halegenticoccus tardaugens TaxID=2071624 RepID=UPI00100B625E|nr:hypothetical protein [Halegenticoccus tardaugens]
MRREFERGRPVSRDRRLSGRLLELPETQQTTALQRASDVDRRRLSELSGQQDELVRSLAGEDLGGVLNDLDSAAEVTRTASGVVVRGERDGVDLEFNYPEDGEGFYVSRSDRIDSADDLKDRSSSEIGRDVVEEDIAPALIKDRKNQEVVFADKRGSDPGIDLIAKDTQTGEYVIVEVKFTRSSEPIGKNKFSSERTLDDGSKATQMSDRWIEDAFEKELLEKGADVPDDLELAIQNGNYRKEAVVVQDSKSDSTITAGLSDPDLDLDGVTIVKTDEVTQ